MRFFLTLLAAGLAHAIELTTPHHTVPTATNTPDAIRQSITFNQIGSTPTACPCLDPSKPDCGITPYTRTKTERRTRGCLLSFGHQNCAMPRCMRPSSTISVSLPVIACPAIRTTTSMLPCRTECPDMAEMCPRTQTVTYQIRTGTDAKPTAVTIWD
jgi:hypothetical protein